MLLMNGTNQQSVLQDLLRYQEIQNGKDSGYPLPTKNELAHRALFAAEINAQVEGNQKKVLDSIGQEHRRGPRHVEWRSPLFAVACSQYGNSVCTIGHLKQRLTSSISSLTPGVRE
jgi:hypothetical protein